MSSGRFLDLDFGCSPSASSQCIQWEDSENEGTPNKASPVFNVKRDDLSPVFNRTQPGGNASQRSTAARSLGGEFEAVQHNQPNSRTRSQEESDEEDIVESSLKAEAKDGDPSLARGSAWMRRLHGDAEGEPTVSIESVDSGETKAEEAPSHVADAEASCFSSTKKRRQMTAGKRTLGLEGLLEKALMERKSDQAMGEHLASQAANKKATLSLHLVVTATEKEGTVTTATCKDAKDPSKTFHLLLAGDKSDGVATGCELIVKQPFHLVERKEGGSVVYGLKNIEMVDRPFVTEKRKRNSTKMLFEWNCLCRE